MTETSRPNFVPASLVRIRCFLNRRGMKVRPWLGPEGVLAAFYAALQLQEKSEAFWIELRELLSDLACDMNQRIKGRGWVIDNELLDENSHEGLLREIRLALGQNPSVSNLHALARALPFRSSSLLLMLAAAMLVGCGGELNSTDGQQSDGGTSNAAGGAAHGGATTPAGGTTAATTIILGNSGGAGGSSITVRASPCATPGATSGLDPSHFAECNQQLVSALIPHDLPNRSGRQLLECACLLNDAWQTGLAELFAAKECAAIADYFACCGLNTFCNKVDNNLLPAEFDANLLVDNSCCLIYLGVRCD